MYFKEILLGTAVGDALGVPVEFCSWEYLQRYPVKEMMGWGTHNQPPGTVSDDTMLMYATGEGLLHDNPIPHIKKNFVSFSKDLFDIGTQTSRSINCMDGERYPGELLFRQKLFLWNGQGNGSLMRIGIIFPLFLNEDPIKALVKIDEFSSLTHPSPVCTIGCAALFSFWRSMVRGKSWEECWEDTVLNMDFFKNSVYYNALINTLAPSGQYLLIADMNALSQLPLSYVRKLPTFFLNHTDFFQHFWLAMQFMHQDGLLIPHITLLYRPTSDLPLS